MDTFAHIGDAWREVAAVDCLVGNAFRRIARALLLAFLPAWLDQRGLGRKLMKKDRLPVPPPRIKVKPHTRAPRRPPPPVAMPGPHEFSPDQEQAMRKPSPAPMVPDTDDDGM